MSNTDPWFDLNNPNIGNVRTAAASGVNGMTINGMTTMLPPLHRAAGADATLAALHGMLDYCRMAGHNCAIAAGGVSGAVTVTHEDPTAPKGSGAMEMFDANLFDSSLHNRDVGAALLAFLGRMHGDPTSDGIGGGRRREGHAPPHVGAARDAREPLSAADLMVGPDDL